MKIMEKIKANTLTYAWLVWLVASLFYAIEYLQRVSITVMALPLMQTFSINASTLSFISSLYFYSYAAAQIPVGLLLDKYGTRKLLSVACAVISIGSLLFAVSKMLWILSVARILIGFGSAFAFIGVLKLASSWFPDKRYPLMVGLTNSLGVAGAIFGQAPLAKLVEATGWQHSMIILSIIGFIISILIWLTILDGPVSLVNQPIKKPLSILPRPVKNTLKMIVSEPQTWVTAIYAGLMVVPIIAFGELWAVPFLAKQYHLTTVMAANINAAIFIGIGIGGPVNGWLSSHFNQQRTVMLLGNLGALICLLTILYVNVPFIALLFVRLFAFGFLTSSMLFAFTINNQGFPHEYNGTVAAFTNIIIVVLGAVFQDLLGLLLDHWRTTSQPNGYTVATYHAALSVLPIVSLLCLGLLLFVHKTEVSSEKY
ncbi:MAG: MFS transporter [Gammaproteobacteria bacterium]